VLLRCAWRARQLPGLLQRANRKRLPHRSHLAWSQSQGEGTYNRCPEIHPTPVPMLAATIRFRLPTTRGEVMLSSGDPSTTHADFFNSWDQMVLEDLVATRI